MNWLGLYEGADAILGDFLDVGVDGYADVVSLDGLDGIDGVHDLAGRVDLDAFDAAIAL